MNIDNSTRALLEHVMEYCDQENKSTEFMIQYMQEVADVDHDTVIKFLKEYGGNEEN